MNEKELKAKLRDLEARIERLEGRPADAIGTPWITVSRATEEEMAKGSSYSETIMAVDPHDDVKPDGERPYTDPARILDAHYRNR